MSLSLDLLTGRKVAPLPETEKILEKKQFGDGETQTFFAECVEFEMLIRRVDKTGKALGGHSCA